MIFLTHFAWKMQTTNPRHDPDGLFPKKLHGHHGLFVLRRFCAYRRPGVSRSRTRTDIMEASAQPARPQFLWREYGGCLNAVAARSMWPCGGLPPVSSSGFDQAGCFGMSATAMMVCKARLGCLSCGAAVLELNRVPLPPSIGPRRRLASLNCATSMKGSHRSVEQPAEGVWLSAY